MTVATLLDEANAVAVSILGEERLAGVDAHFVASPFEEIVEVEEDVSAERTAPNMEQTDYDRFLQSRNQAKQLLLHSYCLVDTGSSGEESKAKAATGLLCLDRAESFGREHLLNDRELKGEIGLLRIALLLKANDTIQAAELAKTMCDDQELSLRHRILARLMWGEARLQDANLYDLAGLDEPRNVVLKHARSILSNLFDDFTDEFKAYHQRDYIRCIFLWGLVNSEFENGQEESIASFKFSMSYSSHLSNRERLIALYRIARGLSVVGNSSEYLIAKKHFLDEVERQATIQKDNQKIGGRFDTQAQNNIPLDEQNKGGSGQSSPVSTTEKLSAKFMGTVMPKLATTFHAPSGEELTIGHVNKWLSEHRGKRDFTREQLVEINDQLHVLKDVFGLEIVYVDIEDEEIPCYTNVKKGQPILRVQAADGRHFLHQKTEFPALRLKG